MTRIAWCALAVAVVWLSACGKDQKVEEGRGAGSPGLLEPSGEIEPVPGTQGMARKARIGQGTNVVFGFVVPQGMTPAPSPARVYRFEGPFPVDQVAAYVRERVKALSETREEGGYLFRGARPMTKTGSPPSPDVLALRVSKGARGGATLDIWLDTRPTPREFAAASSSRPPAEAKPSANPADLARRERAREEAIRVMEKVGRGEPLSAQELESQFFE